MEKIVAVKNLAAVIEQLQQEGYIIVVVLPLTLKKVECYAQPKFVLDGSETWLENGSSVVKEYHVIARRPKTLLELLKIFRW